MIKFLKKIINPLGVDIIGYPSRLVKNRLHLMKYYEINLVFDIGANQGQYVKEIRDAGYRGTIISFEPLKKAYAILAREAVNTSDWKTENVAFGTSIGDVEMNVSENIVSSSMLNITQITTDNAPDSKYINKEKVRMVTLDSIVEKYTTPSDKLFVKIDVQGFEKQVLEGALKSFDKIVGLQLELSFFPIYEDQALFTEILCFLNGYGFVLMSVEPGFYDRESGKLLQADCLFFRN